MRSYAKLIGEIVWASNFTFGQFEILFCHVASPGDFIVGRSMWHSITSDSAQLIILRNAVNSSSKLTKNIRDKILWTIDMAEKLSRSRNDAVHSATISIVENGQAKIIPSDIGTKQSRSNKLREEHDLILKFRKVRGDILQLGQYVLCLWPIVAGFDLLSPLPHRPRLQSV